MREAESEGVAVRLKGQNKTTPVPGIVRGQQMLFMTQTLTRPPSPHVEGGVQPAEGPQTDKASLRSTLVPDGSASAPTSDCSLFRLGKFFPAPGLPPSSPPARSWWTGRTSFLCLCEASRQKGLGMGIGGLSLITWARLVLSPAVAS